MTREQITKRSWSNKKKRLKKNFSLKNFRLQTQEICYGGEQTNICNKIDARKEGKHTQIINNYLSTSPPPRRRPRPRRTHPCSNFDLATALIPTFLISYVIRLKNLGVCIETPLHLSLSGKTNIGAANKYALLCWI